MYTEGAKAGRIAQLVETAPLTVFIGSGGLHLECFRGRRSSPVCHGDVNGAREG